MQPLNEEMTKWIQWLANLTSLDEWLVAGLAFLLTGILGKQTLKHVWLFATGGRKPLGELATLLLQILDEDGLALDEIPLTPALRDRQHTVAFYPKTGLSVFAGTGDVTELLTRRERRLVRRKAWSRLKQLRIESVSRRTDETLAKLRAGSKKA